MAVHATAREFKLAVNLRAKELVDRELSLLTKAVAIRVLRGVVLGTRVDTSRARSNWQVTELVPAEGYDEDKRDPGGSITIEEGNRVIAEATGLSIVWLHNGVPYIGILEDWDKMVHGNVEAMRTWLARG